jgi:hypothetical protein
VAVDRPSDGNVPPNGDARRPDHQDGAALAEPRSRQEYYASLQKTLAKEQFVTAQRITAEERAAAAKWDGDSAESRGIWDEYQSKWPPEEVPPVDRSDDLPGAWRGEKKGFLDPSANARVEAECDRVAEREEDKISPRMRAVEGQDPNRDLIGFEHRLKGRDRVKEKIYGTINDFSRSPEQAVSLLPDAIRFTFQYRESRYTQSVWADVERLKGQRFKLDKLKNFWSDDQYKGINSQWSDLDTGQKFEIQFHTHISFEAKQLTHPAYERLRTRQPDDATQQPDDPTRQQDNRPSHSKKFEQMVLEAFQKKVTADVPVPPGATSIPDYP